jgi:hypothetical protein
MSVGVMEDYNNYKLRDLRASHTLGWSLALASSINNKQTVYDSRVAFTSLQPPRPETTS